jgi:hypothetical protein
MDHDACPVIRCTAKYPTVPFFHRPCFDRPVFFPISSSIGPPFGELMRRVPRSLGLGRLHFCWASALRADAICDSVVIKVGAGLTATEGAMAWQSRHDLHRSLNPKSVLRNERFFPVDPPFRRLFCLAPFPVSRTLQIGARTDQNSQGRRATITQASAPAGVFKFSGAKDSSSMEVIP